MFSLPCEHEDPESSACTVLWLDACSELQESLRHVGAKRMVVGHTVTENLGKPELHCQGKLVMIDVGLSKAYGGGRACLEISGDQIRVVA